MFCDIVAICVVDLFCGFILACGYVVPGLGFVCFDVGAGY